VILNSNAWFTATAQKNLSGSASLTQNGFILQTAIVGREKTAGSLFFQGKRRSPVHSTSLIHHARSLTHSLTSSLTHSLTHSLTRTYARTHARVCSIVCWLLPSFFSYAAIFVHPLSVAALSIVTNTVSERTINYLNHSLHSRIHAFTHPHMHSIRLFLHLCIHSFNRSFMHSIIHSLDHSLYALVHSFIQFDFAPIPSI
jgi:hypothetical protein